MPVQSQEFDHDWKFTLKHLVGGVPLGFLINPLTKNPFTSAVHNEEILTQAAPLFRLATHEIMGGMK